MRFHCLWDNLTVPEQALVCFPVHLMVCSSTGPHCIGTGGARERVPVPKLRDASWAAHQFLSVTCGESGRRYIWRSVAGRGICVACCIGSKFALSCAPMSFRDIYPWLAYGITITIFVVVFALKFRERYWFRRWLWRFLAGVALAAGLVSLIIKLKQLDVFEAFTYAGLLSFAGLAVFALLGPAKQHKPLRNVTLALVATMSSTVLGGLLLLRKRYWLGAVVVVAAFILKKAVVKPRLKKLQAELNNTRAGAEQS